MRDPASTEPAGPGPPAGGAPAKPERSFSFSILAAACGFALILLAYASDTLFVGTLPFRWPLIIVGLAAIAAALGAQAVVRNKVYSAGGMAAIVVIFAGLFGEPKPSFVYGTIRGTDRFPSAVMASNANFLIGRVTDPGDFRFFAREEEIKGPIFSIVARNVEGALPRQIIIGCIEIDLLKRYLGDSDGLDLTMSPDPQDPQNPRWMLVQTTKTKPLGQWGNPACGAGSGPSLRAASLPSGIREGLVPAAYAADPNMAPPTPPLNGQADVEAIFRELDHAEFAFQVRAQDRVAKLQDAPSISAIVKAWKAPWNDRVDTGLVVAWVRSIRLDRALAVPIASALSKEQLDHIVDLAGSRDSTVRFNATELLSWMLQSTGWPSPPPGPQPTAILEAALRPFTSTQDFFQRAAPDVAPAARALSAYNTMVALNDAKCVMREADRGRTSQALASFAASAAVQAYGLQKTAAAAGQFLQKPC